MKFPPFVMPASLGLHLQKGGFALRYTPRYPQNTPPGIIRTPHTGNFTGENILILFWGACKIFNIVLRNYFCIFWLPSHSRIILDESKENKNVIYKDRRLPRVPSSELQPADIGKETRRRNSGFYVALYHMIIVGWEDANDLML